MAGYKNYQVDRNKNKNNSNLFTKSKNFNKTSDNMTKNDRLMEGVNKWCGFYRENPHRFVKDYFGLELKLFQIILLYMMNEMWYFMYLASRGCLIFYKTK